MSVYQLTHTEAWVLATALHLPVQPDSALADWFASAPVPDMDQVTGAALNSLAAKGYYRRSNAAEPFPQGLLKSLALLSVNAATLTALIRTNGRSALTRFAQVGEGIVQVGMDESHLSLFDVAHVRNIAATLVPAWFAPGRNDGLRDELTLGAFLLFSHACNLEDWASARSDFQTEAFPVQELLDTFQRGSRWLDVFGAAGVPGVAAVAQLPLQDYLNDLVNRGYLAAVGQGYLAIGAVGKPLASALTAPESCSLTVTLQTAGSAETPSGAFVHGDGRLFLVEIASGQVRIQQLPGLESGQGWIERLLEQGRRAHYVEYVIPGAAAGPQAAAAQSVCVECGSPLPPGSQFCSQCGARQSRPAGSAAAAPTVLPSARTTPAMSLRALSGQLAVLSGSLAGRQIALGEELSIGRDTDNGLQLPDEASSRHHALIRHQGDRYEISDLGSSNGTRVNGTRITGPTPLADGDTIVIGTTQLAFRLAAQAG